MSLFDFQLFKKKKSTELLEKNNQVQLKAQTSIAEREHPVAETSNKKSGFFDGVHESGFLYGWAYNPLEAGRNQKLYLFINQILVGSAWTWQDRPDVGEAKGVYARNAGFYCALHSEIYFQLLQSGYELTVAFDVEGRERLGGRLALDSVNIPRLLGGSLRHIATDKGDVPYDQIHKIFTASSLSEFIHWTDKACIFIDYFLSQYQVLSDKEFLIQVEKTAKSWGLPNNNLELKLLRVLWAVDHNTVEQIDISSLEMAFLERVHQSDPLGNYQGLKNRDIHLLNVLQQKLFFIAQSSSDQILIAISKISFTFGKWIEKLGGQDPLALAFLDLARHQDVLKMNDPLAIETLGKLQRRENRNILAADNFKVAIASEKCSWYSFHELAVMIRIFSQVELGYSALPMTKCISLWIKASTLNPSQALSFREAVSYSNQFFDNLLSITTLQAQSGSEMSAVVNCKNNLSALGKATEELYLTQQIAPCSINSQGWISKNNLKILFLGSKNLHQCFYYRIFQKMETLKTLGFECEFIDTDTLLSIAWRESLMGVAMLYLCRTALTNNQRHLASYAKALQIPIVYDVDDLIFDAEYFPPSLSTYARTLSLKEHLHLRLDCPLFSEALKMADFVTVSTNTLASQVQKFVAFNTPIFVLPNLLGNSIEVLARKQRDRMQGQAGSLVSKNAKKSRIKIFYGSGTKAHKQVFYEVFLPAALAILKEFDQVDLHLIGFFENLPAHLLKTGRIVLREITSDFFEYLNLLQEMDINIAILEQSLVTDAKSEIKWLEAAAFAIPSIVSPTATYREALTDKENVVFAKTSADWKAELRFLISDSLARDRIGKNAQELALQKFSPAKGADILQSILKASGMLPMKKRKKRILICNVYFAPQSNGGATRVAETQVRGLLEQYADEYDVYVLTTSDFTSSSAGSMEVEQYWYRDCLVTRLSLPNNDWSAAENHDVYSFCKRFFTEYQFDLIHMHSMQVLTGSVGMAAKDLNIPYIVTLHDAWWLSRYMFLIDEFGNSVDPANPLSGGSVKSQDEIKALLTRDKILRDVLKNARTRLAVSQKFADLYMSAGVADVQVHENIVEPFEVYERQPDPDGKIVLGFIGGMSKHKGYHLFRQALEEGEFDNFKALVVDTSLNEGETHETIWGKTRVKFIPKVKQNEIGKLYAQMDVLVAPSIWPESFGLVTREAMMAGVWVIASDIGVIGEDVVEGENGNVIRVDNFFGLCKIFINFDFNKVSKYSTSNIKKQKNLIHSHMMAYVEFINNFTENIKI